MLGEIKPVWNELWTNVWRPLADHADAPEDLFSELYREFNEFIPKVASEDDILNAANDPQQAEHLFKKVEFHHFDNDDVVVQFLERLFIVIIDISENGDSLSNHYFLLVERFLAKYSLRYELRRPFNLTPTLQGLFASLMKDLKVYAKADAHLHALTEDFDDAVRDLRGGLTEGRIKTCLVKQYNLLEAIGMHHPDVTKDTLGAICDEISDWPHESVRDAMKNLYKFGCNYPGIRHGGTPTKAVRAIQTKDLISLTLVLASFSPYLIQNIDYDNTYKGI